MYLQVFVFLSVFLFLYLGTNYLVPGRLCNLEHHLVALELAGEIGGVMMMEQTMIMTMVRIITGTTISI